MKQAQTIVITGAAGFIGSVMVGMLNELGYTQLILVDDFSRKEKAPNLLGKKFNQKVHREQFFDWLAQHPDTVDAIIHLGARTDTTLTDKQVFKILNVDYTKRLFEWCTEHNIPFIYASSAATYGNGAHGYSDDESLLPQLDPLNQYAKSKQEIDLWITDQKKKPSFWAGFKFFNVYGPNESHKGRMASVVYHAYNEILKNGYVTLFKSHHKDYKDGEQLRDFIYVKDVVRILIYFLEHQPKSGIFNLGTGKAATFLSLVQALFEAIGHQGKIKFIDTPENIRENYQYFTEANIEKLRAAGYTGVFADIREGIADYAVNYLETTEQF